MFSLCHLKIDVELSKVLKYVSKKVLLSLSPSFSLLGLLHLPTGGGVVLIKGGVGIRVTGWKNVCMNSIFFFFFFFLFSILN
jgi:hypothetical protein